MNASDFPRYEDRSISVSQQQSSIHRQSSTSIPLSTSAMGGINQESADPLKPPPKKRGRKPRSYYLELEAKEAAARLAAESSTNLKGGLN